MNKYKIIYADAPWRFKNWSIGELSTRGERWARRNGRSPYPVMTTDDICQLPVREIADKDSLLYLWATGPKMIDAEQVCESWGFQIVTHFGFVWVKQNPSGIGWHFGLGYYTHANVENVIIARRGQGVKRVDKGVSQLVFYPRGEHSAKPPTVANRIERLHGDVPRVELFARRDVVGWDRWGNEVNCSPDTEPLWDYLAPPYDVVVDDDEYLGLPSMINSPMPSESYEDGEQMALIY